MLTSQEAGKQPSSPVPKSQLTTVVDLVERHLRDIMVIMVILTHRMSGQPGHTGQTAETSQRGQRGQRGQTGQTGQTDLTFKFDSPGNLCRAASAILAMYFLGLNAEKQKITRGSV